ncbi:hypothetical protein ACGE0T_13290 [Parabacteroides sp. APC149_11_2_Y6]
MKTKLQGLCPSCRPVQALAASIYLLAAVLLASCTAESDKTDRSTEEADSANKREVLLSFKNKLTVKTTKADTKADAPIATEAENEIATLDVYVFGAKAEGDAYSFRERFSYRQDGSPLPAGAKELNLTPSTDNTTTTALLELQKGLFVRLYCIANQTELINPADGNPIADTYFAPLTYDMETGALTDGTPSENDFCKFHSPLLTDASPALGLPLPMTGAQITPIDLTDFSSSARVQVGFKLTRTMARFDVSNIEKDSKFHLESISMGNGRKGTTFFPVKVYGAAPAADGELITYPACAFEGEKANEGLQVSAFYSYPSPLEDKGYLILNGSYQVNKTEVKDVSYQIPFIQQTADGGEVALEINANHRYTIGITKADEYHLDFTLDVAEWDEGGSIDDYDPNAGTDGDKTTITIADALKDKISYNADTRTVTMNTLQDGDGFTVEVGSSHEPEVQKTYPGSVAAQQYDWLEVSAATPVTKAAVSGYQYTVSVKAGYNKDDYPKAVLRFVNSMSGKEETVIVEPNGIPNLSSPATVTLHAGADNTIPTLTITGKSLGGSTIEGPEWLTYKTTSSDKTAFSYVIELNPSKANFPETLPTDQTITIKNKANDSKTTEVTVSFTEANAWLVEDLANYDESTSSGYRVKSDATKTMTVSFYSMFAAPELITPTYDGTYCTNSSMKTWLGSSKLAKTEVENNRRKYTFNIVVNAATGTDAAYQLHKGGIGVKHNTTTVKSYTIWRGASYYGYPTNGGVTPYYAAIKKGSYWWAPIDCGATRVAQAGDGKKSVVAGIGNIYQWGRADYTNHGGSTASGPISNSKPNNHVFYTSSSTPEDWLTPQNNNLWKENSKGVNDPCPQGYRVPTADELWSIGNATTWNEGLFKVNAEKGFPQLVLSAAGYRLCSNGLSYHNGVQGNYWTSSVEGTKACVVYFTSTQLNRSTDRKAIAWSVRCIKE